MKYFANSVRPPKTQKYFGQHHMYNKFIGATFGYYIYIVLRSFIKIDIFCQVLF